MSSMPIQITGVASFCSTVGPGVDQGKHQSSVSLAFVTQKASNAENVSIWWRHHVSDKRSSTL